MNRDNMSGTVFTFVVGVGVGAAAALLFAPKAGEDLREDIAGRVNDGVDHLRSTGKDLKRRGQKLVNMAKDEAADALDAATDAFNHAKRG
jgi:gas vesicle protein